MNGGMKYGNKKTTVFGRTFDSKREAERYLVLRSMESKGEISDLRCQVEYELIPAQKKSDGKTERSTKYIADFTYQKNGKTVVEDTKGFRTREYILKRKLMLFRYSIEVKEI